METLIKALGTNQVWEDLVEDFLEVACYLNRAERRFLVHKLRQYRVLAETIEGCPGFILEKRVILVASNLEAKECWIYDPKNRSVRKFTL